MWSKYVIGSSTFFTWPIIYQNIFILWWMLFLNSILKIWIYSKNNHLQFIMAVPLDELKMKCQICICWFTKHVFYISETQRIISPPSVLSVSSHTPAWSPAHGSWPLDGSQETFPPWTAPETLAGSAVNVSKGIQINTQNHSLHSSSCRPPSWPVLFNFLFSEHYGTLSADVTCTKTKLMLTFRPVCVNLIQLGKHKYCASSLNNEL